MSPSSSPNQPEQRPAALRSAPQCPALGAASNLTAACTHKIKVACMATHVGETPLLPICEPERHWRRASCSLPNRPVQHLPCWLNSNYQRRSSLEASPVPAGMVSGCGTAQSGLQRTVGPEPRVQQQVAQNCRLAATIQSQRAG